MRGCLPIYDLMQLAPHEIAGMESVREAISRIEVQAISDCGDTQNLPSVSNGQNWAGLRVKPSLGTGGGRGVRDVPSAWADKGANP